MLNTNYNLTTSVMCYLLPVLTIFFFFSYKLFVPNDIFTFGINHYEPIGLGIPIISLQCQHQNIFDVCHIDIL